MPFPVLLPFVNDLKLVVERGMTGATGNFYCGLHEAGDMAFPLHFLRETDYFYDIGANVGTYSLIAAAAGVSRILAFEPSTDTAAKLRRNVLVNDLADQISIHCVALGSEKGECRFTRGADTVNHVVALGESVPASELVQVRTLDEFFVTGPPSFIKIDVEGFESAVLGGAAAALKDPSLMGLLVEGDGRSGAYGNRGFVRDILGSNGFSTHRYDPILRRLTSNPEGHTSTGNLLFLRDVENATRRVSNAPKFRLSNGWI